MHHAFHATLLSASGIPMVLDAVLARDAATATRLLREHYEETLEAVRRAEAAATGSADAR